MPTLASFRATTVAFAILSSALCAAPAGAVDLIAIGRLPGTQRDLSGQSALLENGVPGDLLGGLGSGLAWAGGSTFLALPDRGPNAVPWNAGVDDTTSYIPRFHTLQLDLVPMPDPATGLPFTLRPTLTSTTLLFSHASLTYGGIVDGHAGAPAANSYKIEISRNHGGMRSRIPAQMPARRRKDVARDG